MVVEQDALVAERDVPVAEQDALADAADVAVQPPVLRDRFTVYLLQGPCSGRR